MIEYKAIYDENYNEIIGYELNGSFIPIAKGNKDYMEMLELVKNGEAKIIELTEEEKQAKKQEIENKKKIEEAKKYLDDTDWIVIKINEYEVKGDTEKVEYYKDKYSDILIERQNKRDIINQLGG